MKIALVAAAADNDVIGNKGALPWHLPDDLRHFRDLTRGHPVIMGRKTFESIGRPLPGRLNIVISRNPEYAHEGCTVAASLDEALVLAKEQDADCIFVIGGGEIYRAALPYATHVYLTRVHAEVEGDAFFPALSEDDWQVVASEEHSADERHAFAFTFELYERACSL